MSAGLANASQRLTWALIVAMVLGALSDLALAQADDILTIRTAIIRTRMEGDANLSAPRAVSLPFRWDAAFPRHAGEMWFEVSLPPRPSAAIESLALYAPRLGNRSEIFFESQRLLVVGIGEKSTNYHWQPHVLLLPANAGTLRLHIEADAMARSGLGLLYVGPIREIQKRAARDAWVRLYIPLATTSLILVVAIAAAFLFVRTRETLYLIFVGFALVWLGRLVVMGLAWHTVLLQAAYLLYALVVICFMVCLFGLDLRKHLLRLAPFFALLLLASFVTIRSGQEDVYPLLIAALMTIGYSVLAILFAWRQPNAERIALAGAMSVTVVAALIDLWTLRSSETALGRLEWTPIAALVYALVFGAILAGRYVKSIDHFRELTQHLESRVAEREAKIETIYLREQTLVKRGAAEAAVREERGRIMRDMHDGLGAKLVTMLNTLQNGHTTQADLSAQVRESLDELRLTIDSLEDSEGDLTSVLGHLRFRLDKRFTEAGIRFDWRVAPLPALSILTPANVQHVQRLLLEVFTNILKHAKATCVTVSTEEAADGVTISIADDGVGFNVDDSTQQHGRGMTNMHFRANALGGTVKIQSPCASSGTGTEVRLWLPLFAE